MLKNPFLNRVMVRNPEQFFGRSREIRAVFNRLNAETPQSVAVVGMRRVGKSSLLYHCTHPHVRKQYLEEPERYIFTYLDLQSIRGGNPDTFFKTLSDAVLREKPDADLPDAHDYHSFTALITTLEQSGLRWIILLDEFEILARNAHFGSEFFSFLRSLANTHPVAYVTATGVHLEKLCHTREIADSPFFNIFAGVRLGPFPTETAVELIETLSTSAEITLPVPASAIIDKAGRLPMYLQMGAAAAVETLDPDHPDTPPKPSQMWPEMEELFMNEAKSHLNYLWRNFNGPERLVLCRLALDKPVKDKSLAHVVRNLAKDGIINDPDHHPRLDSQWFKSFFAEKAETDPPPELVKKGFFGKIADRFKKKGKKDIPEGAFVYHRMDPPKMEIVRDANPKIDQIVIMFTDIKGFTQFFERYGNMEGIELIQRHNELLFPVIEEKKGRIVKTIGDAIMASFQNPAESIDAAVVIQRLLDEENRHLPPEKQIHVRIALNAGEGIIKSGDVFGDVVNTASRMESLADAGQIIISEELYDIVKDPPKFRCRFLQKVKFKGKTRETAVYQVSWEP